jgi:tyrosyl-tRNA synthetase
MTLPLLVDSSGNKLGKSTGGGGVWLDPNLTSPFDLYQYLVNTTDADVEQLLVRLTFLSFE